MAAFGAWLFVSVMAVGAVVVSIGLYIAQSYIVALAGFAVIGGAAVAGGLVVVRGWRELNLRYRAFGVCLLIAGAYMLFGIARWLVATGRVG